MGDAVALMEEEMFDKKRIKRFSGCFGCGMPQAICPEWVTADDDGGRFARDAGGQCHVKAGG